MTKKKAIVLLSGGMDSATALYLAKSEGYEVYSLSFNYGQRHIKELKYAEKLAKKASVVEHKVAIINLDLWGHSALTDTNIDVPTDNVSPDKEKEIPITYVPARNMIFLSIATSYAEAIGARDIFLGVSQVDYSGYVDCRKEFIDAMQTVINKGTVCGANDNDPITLHAPFLHMTKADEIRLGEKLGVDYSLTTTCYQGGEIACGKCDSCVLRLKAFEEVGIEDPILYVD